MATSTGRSHKLQPNQVDCLSYLQNLENVTPSEAAALLDKLASRIRVESEKPDPSNVNQAALNVSFRVYYQILHQFELPDTHFGDIVDQLTYQHPNVFLMLLAVLLTDHHARLNPQVIEEKCINAIIDALQQNSASLVPVLKATNLLVKKYPKLQLLPLQLHHFYHCLQKQSQTGSREETLTLFNHCCKQRYRAFLYFRIIVNFWPWTNRNKYYLLSGILNSHALEELLEESAHSEKEFFAGLRLSLSYKSLRAASQYTVKSLSGQSSAALLELAVDVLMNGSVAEIQNFYSQWFLRFQQRDVLFQLLQTNPEIVDFLQHSENARSGSDQYRLTLIFSMFAKEIYAVSKLHFFKISTELLTNFSGFEPDAQLLIFKFLVDNLANFAVEDCLDFFINFIQQHRYVESAEFRNTLLGKMPTIINHAAKHFHKIIKVNGSTTANNCSAMACNIERFFQQLQVLIDNDIKSDVYQPKIFALKLLEILINSLYASQVAKNAKMCSTQQNQQLGKYLLERGVFQPIEISSQIFQLIHDPQGFDDALELIVTLLQQLGHITFDQCAEQCFTLCQSSDVDECALVVHFARLAVHNLESASQATELYDKCLNLLREKFETYQRDPLQTAKSSGGHLFGLIYVLSVLVGGYEWAVPTDPLISLLERILNAILNFLNLANVRQSQATTAASFQDMDESLQLLVVESAFKGTASEEEDYRKYLLMSFWLTLKATCELATSVGCALLRRTQEDINYAELKRCLDINVAVLTLCRHKGAIEAAGLSIGKLTQAITGASVPGDDARFQLLHDCLEGELLTDSRQVSTTRRGAGFSIMFLHIVKNDSSRQRFLLHRAMKLMLQRLNETSVGDSETTVNNQDCWQSLCLHYLCVLVRDTELRGAMSKYYNEIMLVAMAHIDNNEWTISNAALQLFGALVPKLVGQRQATQFDSKLMWEPSELSYDELNCLLPKACEHMLRRCESNPANSSLILFLGFLSKVEHLHTIPEQSCSGTQKKNRLLDDFKQLSWRLLRHNCEQVRHLAAICFVRAHEFRLELPVALLAIAKLSTELQEVNFYEGIVHTLHAGVLKLQHEARNVWPSERLLIFQTQLVAALNIVTDNLGHLNSYTLNVLLELLDLLQATDQMETVRNLLGSRQISNGEEITLKSLAI